MQSIGAEPSQLPQANGRCVTLPSQREAIYATAKLRLDVCKSFNACYTSSLCMIQPFACCRSRTSKSSSSARQRHSPSHKYSPPVLHPPAVCNCIVAECDALKCRVPAGRGHVVCSKLRDLSSTQIAKLVEISAIVIAASRVKAKARPTSSAPALQQRCHICGGTGRRHATFRWSAPSADKSSGSTSGRCDTRNPRLYPTRHGIRCDTSPCTARYPT